MPVTLTSEQKEEVIAFAAELIRLSGVSGKEEAAAVCVRRKMEALGYDEVHTDGYGSVIAVLKGELPGKTLLFDGHLDVVAPGDHGAWSHDPFGGEITEGRIWGRGAADMKGALAAMICAPAYLNRSELKGTIIVSASVAEELLIGVALNHILESFPADAVVIGEPTGLKIGRAEKGRAGVEVICHGTPAHSSRPELGDNAVYRMMEAAQRIRELPRKSHPQLGVEVIELVEIGSLPVPGNGSVPPYCRTLWECRLLPGETREEFLGRWESALEGVGRTEIRIAGYSLSSYKGPEMRLDDFLPGWETEFPETGFTASVTDAVRKCGRTGEHYAVPYGCNALISAGLKNIPTVILGPGDISLAHKPDEYITIEDLLAAAEIYGQICLNMSVQ